MDFEMSVHTGNTACRVTMAVRSQGGVRTIGDHFINHRKVSPMGHILGTNNKKDCSH